MDSVELTTKEKEELKKAVQQAKIYKGKKLRELILMTLGATTLVVGVSYWVSKLSWAIFLVGLTVGLLLLLVFFIVWYSAGKPVDKMEKDLELGIVKTGRSEIKRISIFNRAIHLADETIVYEDDAFYGKWKKADKIFYRTTNSGEHLFECRRVE